MEKKYFTPDIEDFHVGYEFQGKVYGEKDEWVNCLYSKPTDEMFCKDSDGNIWVNDSIRVPYLTKEQIEAEGWKYYQTIPDSIFSKSYVEYYKDVEWFKIVISISETSHYLTIEKVFQNVRAGNGLQEFRNTMYNGECKDINTFRKLCKLLHI
jgi:hypothetical protein